MKEGQAKWDAMTHYLNKCLDVAYSATLDEKTARVYLAAFMASISIIQGGNTFPAVEVTKVLGILNSQVMDHTSKLIKEAIDAEESGEDKS